MKTRKSACLCLVGSLLVLFLFHAPYCLGVAKDGELDDAFKDMYAKVDSDLPGELKEFVAFGNEGNITATLKKTETYIDLPLISLSSSSKLSFRCSRDNCIDGPDDRAQKWNLNYPMDGSMNITWGKAFELGRDSDVEHETEADWNANVISRGNNFFNVFLNNKEVDILRNDDVEVESNQAQKKNNDPVEATELADGSGAFNMSLKLTNIETSGKCDLKLEFPPDYKLMSAASPAVAAKDNLTRAGASSLGFIIACSLVVCVVLIPVFIVVYVLCRRKSKKTSKGEADGVEDATFNQTHPNEEMVEVTAVSHGLSRSKLSKKNRSGEVKTDATQEDKTASNQKNRKSLKPINEILVPAQIKRALAENEVQNSSAPSKKSASKAIGKTYPEKQSYSAANGNV